jgi:hypothetical protein
MPGEIISTVQDRNDPDDDKLEVTFVPVHEIRNYMNLSGRGIPVENWMREKVMKYYRFDLDVEGFAV